MSKPVASLGVHDFITCLEAQIPLPTLKQRRYLFGTDDVTIFLEAGAS
jgi:hypothetical protein